MNVRYFFAVFAIILFISSDVKASDRIIIQEKTHFITSLTVYKISLFHSKKVSPLLNKVFLPAHPGNHAVLWKSLTSFWGRVGVVYAKLWRYLCASIFFIFK
ncbi:hypothetical protein HNQ69_000571 [Bartonella callosciuri]|uniref:Uncharacterized protein n=1 Tax=Bartonella callosciuri TaxID=686223 RepID=A0A840NNK0_9HYPH|nr:hypothetical protein [Bartonella callosciuri]